MAAPTRPAGSHDHQHHAAAPHADGKAAGTTHSHRLPAGHPDQIRPLLPGDSGSGSTAQLARGGLIGKLSGHTWFAPAVMLTIALVLGVTHMEVLASLKAKLRADLNTIIDADVTALDIWLTSRDDAVRSIADSKALRDLVGSLYHANHTGTFDAEALRARPEQAALRAYMKPIVESNGFRGFTIVDIHHQVIASEIDGSVGTILKESLSSVVAAFSAGKTLITPPFKSSFTYADGVKAGDPVMFAVTPIREPDSDRVIAGFALRMNPDDVLARIVSVARPGSTGELYLFDRNGVMLSRSRFEDQLRAAGLIKPGQSSALNIDLRDPQVNLTQGQQSRVPIAARALTLPVANAISGEPNWRGANVDGYRDYRGVRVVGSWRWLPDRNIGAIYEQDVDEAWDRLLLPMRALWVVFGLVLLFVIASLVGTRINRRLRDKISEVKEEARQLGQYRLEQLIGEGGMGSVYRASHAMLRRPTAVKLVRAEHATHESLVRFEREVQMTSRLAHPNTIAVFDYGRTPDGVFYYAMELLPGLSLQQLVTQYGPQPAARVIHILVQVCGSLAEAHSVRLIHRDVKPGNLMLCNRGGVRDFVKVLDFGLVKLMPGAGISPAGDDPDQSRADYLIGTPHYMSPQQLLQPDAVDERADVWSLGAVGYYLLTGRPAVEGSGVMDVISWHMQRRMPVPPSQQPGIAPVAPDLDRLIMRCIAHDPSDRPSGMDELSEAFERCADHGRWTRSDANAWWQHHRPDQLGAHPTDATSSEPLVES
ncbi:MAG: serine/threonine protein kinase [Planctomycetota bacterium]